MSEWKWSRRDAVTCLILVIGGGLLWLPGLAKRGLWTSGEARAGQVARRMVAHDDFITMRQEMNEPRLTVSDAASTQFDADGDREVLVGVQRRTVLWNLSAAKEDRTQNPPRLETQPLRPDIAYEQLITLHKPALYYWMIAAPAKWLGMPINAFTIRCFSTVPAILLLPLTYLLGSTMFDRRAGLLAAVCLCTCVRFYWIARVSRMDMVLALFMTLALACWYWGHGTRRWRVALPCLIGVVLTLAAASLLKSPMYVGPFLAVAGLSLAAEWRTKRGSHPHRTATQWAGLVVGVTVLVGVSTAVYLALVVPWYYRIDVATDGQYTLEMFGRHMAARAGLAEYGKEFQTRTSWWFYGPRMLADLFPWVILLPGAVVQVFRSRSRDTRAAGFVLVCWVGILLALFSYMPYRKSDYLLPLYPAAMLLVGKLLADQMRNVTTDLRMSRVIKLGFGVVGVGLLGGGVFALALLSPQFIEWAATAPMPWSGEPLFGTNQNDATAFRALSAFGRTHAPLAVSGLVLFVGLMAAAAWFAGTQRTGPAVGLLAGGMAALMLVGTHLFTDRLNDPHRSQRAVARAITALTAGEASNTRLILFGSEQHELVFLLPNRFDAVPGTVSPPDYDRSSGLIEQTLWALHSRLAALRDQRVLVVAERKLWEQFKGQVALYRRLDKELGELELPLREVPTPIPDYDVEHHREPLVILERVPEAP